MRIARSLRLTLLAFAISLIPASSYAGVFVSVNFGPRFYPSMFNRFVHNPASCGLPATGPTALTATTGFPAPGCRLPISALSGLLATGAGGGLYVFHPGYWGRHVGYYGGVNYGFGYMGIGFAGGMWRGGAFAYNAAVVHVGVGGGWGRQCGISRRDDCSQHHHH